MRKLAVVHTFVIIPASVIYRFVSHHDIMKTYRKADVWLHALSSVLDRGE